MNTEIDEGPGITLGQIIANVLVLILLPVWLPVFWVMGFLRDWRVR